MKQKNKSLCEVVDDDSGQFSIMLDSEVPDLLPDSFQLFLLNVDVPRLWRISAFTAAMAITMGTYFTVSSKASCCRLAIH